jgi:hypothetical protein
VRLLSPGACLGKAECGQRDARRYRGIQRAGNAPAHQETPAVVAGGLVAAQPDAEIRLAVPQPGRAAVHGAAEVPVLVWICWLACQGPVTVPRVPSRVVMDQPVALGAQHRLLHADRVWCPSAGGCPDLAICCFNERFRPTASSGPQAA